MRLEMLLRDARRLAGRVRRELWPSPEEAAWKQAVLRADRVGRHVPGEIALGPYHLRYLDLLTVCPQWQDIFVAQRLRFRAATPTPRILDCGANVGLATLYFKQLYPGARVTAYEADARLAAVLRDNLARNGAADVDVVHGAVWAADEPVQFAGEGDDAGAVTGTGRSAAGVAVPGIRLRDRIAAETWIDLLKMDIEGAEAAVIDDCAGVLDRVDALILEIHEFDPTRRVTGRVLDRLAAAGYRVALDELVPLAWRTLASPATPFPGTPLQWAVQVRAWREPAGGVA